MLASLHLHLLLCPMHEAPAAMFLAFLLKGRLRHSNVVNPNSDLYFLYSNRFLIKFLEDNPSPVSLSCGSRKEHAGLYLISVAAREDKVAATSIFHFSNDNIIPENHCIWDSKCHNIQFIRSIKNSIKSKGPSREVIWFEIKWMI